MTKQIKQPIANPTHVITTDGTDQISEVGHSTLSVVKEALSLDAVPNLDTTDAFNKAHDQNTDTALDLGGANEVTAADARAHIDATDNPHNVTATQVGLGNVDNVSAADLRDRTTHTGEQAISTVTGLQSALDDKADKTTTFTAGVGLDGGGDLSGNRTFDLSAATQASLSAADTALQPGDPATDVSYDNTSSGLAATDVQAAIDENVETLLGRKNQIAQGFIQREQTRGDLDVDLAVAIELNLIGAPVAGGYYAGIIDTIKGDIIAADAYQTGERYALIVSPQSLEGGRGTATGDLRWYTSNTGAANGADTRWNGLEATNAILVLADTDFEAHGHIDSVRSSDPAPATPGGSDWYMPAMDELELLYRNFKPNNADNFTDDRSSTFPGNQVQGTNPSSDPNGIPYENGPRIPDVTYLDSFKENAAESLSQLRYWSTTWASTGRAWSQGFTLSGVEGDQRDRNKTLTSFSVRPVRRVVL